MTYTGCVRPTDEFNGSNSLRQERRPTSVVYFEFNVYAVFSRNHGLYIKVSLCPRITKITIM